MNKLNYKRCHRFLILKESDICYDTQKQCTSFCCSLPLLPLSLFLFLQTYNFIHNNLLLPVLSFENSPNCNLIFPFIKKKITYSDTIQTFNGISSTLFFIPFKTQFYNFDHYFEISSVFIELNIYTK